MTETPADPTRYAEKKEAFEAAIREKDLRMRSENIAESELRREWRRKTPHTTPHGAPVPQSLAEFLGEATESGRYDRMKADARRELERRWPAGLAKPLVHSDEHCAVMRGRLAPLMRELSAQLSAPPERSRSGDFRAMTPPAAEKHLSDLAAKYASPPAKLGQWLVDDRARHEAFEAELKKKWEAKVSAEAAEAAAPFDHEPLDAPF